MEAIKVDKESKKLYQTPKLKVYGNVQKLTTRGNGSDDAGTQRLR